MGVHIRYFGMIAERLGKKEETIDLDVLPGNSLHAWFCARLPELLEMQFTIAVDQDIRDSLRAGEIPHEIALLPPFAGG